MARLTDARYEATRINPGYGRLASEADVVAYRDMLSTALEGPGKLKAAGKSPEDIVAKKPLVDLQAECGDGNFSGDGWIGLIYDGI